MWKCLLNFNHLSATCTQTSPPPSGGFSWEDLASIVTVLAFVGGIIITIYFGRKATVAVKAEAHPHSEGYTLSVRSSVIAIGYFKFKFAALT